MSLGVNILLHWGKKGTYHTKSLYQRLISLSVTYIFSKQKNCILTGEAPSWYARSGISQKWQIQIKCSFNTVRYTDFKKTTCIASVLCISRYFEFWCQNWDICAPLNEISVTSTTPAASPTSQLICVALVNTFSFSNLHINWLSGDTEFSPDVSNTVRGNLLLYSIMLLYYNIQCWLWHISQAWGREEKERVDIKTRKEEDERGGYKRGREGGKIKDKKKRN